MFGRAPSGARFFWCARQGALTDFPWHRRRAELLCLRSVTNLTASQFMREAEINYSLPSPLVGEGQGEGGRDHLFTLSPTPLPSRARGVRFLTQ